MADPTNEELMLKEEQLVRISAGVIYGCGLALISATVWLTSIQLYASQTRKDLDDHMHSGAEYRQLNDQRWLRVNNALIRLQYKQGIKIPKGEIEDALSDE